MVRKLSLIDISRVLYLQILEENYLNGKHNRHKTPYFSLTGKNVMSSLNIIR